MMVTGREGRCHGLLGFLRLKSKKRTLSLDETTSTVQSQYDGPSQPDCLDTSWGSLTSSRRTGGLPKATALLLSRRVSASKGVKGDDEDVCGSRPHPLPLKSCLKKCTSTNCGSPAVSPAVQARQDAIRAQQRLLGKDHPDVLFSLESLAQFHYRRGEDLQAEQVRQEKQRLSTESYWNQSPSKVPSTIIIVHEDD